MAMLRLRILLITGLICLTGCVLLKEPYPKEWAELNIVKGMCPDISGIYSDEGWLDPSEAKQLDESWHKRSLSELLLTDRERIDDVSHVAITQDETHNITVTAWKGSKSVAEQSFYSNGGDFRCESGFIEFIGKRVCETGDGVMGCSTEETHMAKNDKGHLIAKTNTHGFGAVYLVPLYFSQWHWYRFDPVSN